MFTPNEQAFADAHPKIAERYAQEGLEWLNVYTDYEGRGIKERWERNKDGVLVDVTAREKAREELIRAQEELEDIRRNEHVHA